MRTQTRFVALSTALLSLTACAQIIGLEEGEPNPKGTGGDTGAGGSGGHGIPCPNGVTDCPAPGDPSCGNATCEAGVCGLQTAMEGTVLPPAQQMPGDCATFVCDSSGGRKSIPADDPKDDGSECTDDVCVDGQVKHNNLLSIPCYDADPVTLGIGPCKGGVRQCSNGQPDGACVGQVVPEDETCLTAIDDNCNGQVNESGTGCSCTPGAEQGCYTGDASTLDVGICHGGTQACNPDGQGFGSCVGEQAPTTETCDVAKLDEDCDGQVNESGSDCVCGDGTQSNSEECDDGNTSNTDACTAMCKSAKCGDAFVQAGVEACDDGNPVNTDACLTTCVAAKCGDGFIRQGIEYCDDSNVVAGDGCSSSCLTEGVSQVAAGWSGACAASIDGRVKCWGNALLAGHGDLVVWGDMTNEMGTALPVTQLGTGKKASTIVSARAGGAGSCAILTDQSLKCWGLNNHGQLGLGDKLNRGDDPGEMGDSLPTVPVGNVQQVSIGRDTTCALLTNGTVKCWGAGAAGALGQGNMNDLGDQLGEVAALAAINLGTGKTAVALATGDVHACAILNGGVVKCWGYGPLLGIGVTDNRGDGPAEMGDALPAVNLGTGKTAVAISAAGQVTCALLNDSTVKCWGLDVNCGIGVGIAGTTSYIGDAAGEMGDALPSVALPSPVVAIASGGQSGSTCALTSLAELYCWGNNGYGQLGFYTPGGPIYGVSKSPGSAVSLGSGVLPAGISVGGEMACVWTSGQNGRVKCWGHNNSGGLGLGDTMDRGAPTNSMGNNLPFVHTFGNVW